MQNTPEYQTRQLTQLVDKLAISSQIGDAQTLRINELADIIADLPRNEHNLQLNNFYYICTKTGKSWQGELTPDEFVSIIKIHGESKAIFAARQQFTNQIHPQWVFTDNKSLKELSLHDPYGYAAYCCIQILKTYHESDDLSQQWKFSLSKQTLYNNLQKLPMPLIARAGEQFRQYLSIISSQHAKNRISWQMKDLSNIAMTESRFRLFLSDVVHNLAKVIQYEISQGHIHADFAPADLVRLKQKYQGNTAMNMQKLAKDESESDELERVLFAFLDDNPDAFEIKKPKRQSRVDRLADTLPDIGSGMAIKEYWNSKRKERADIEKNGAIYDRQADGYTLGFKLNRQNSATGISFAQSKIQEPTKQPVSLANLFTKKQD